MRTVGYLLKELLKSLNTRSLRSFISVPLIIFAFLAVFSFSLLTWSNLGQQRSQIIAVLQEDLSESRTDQLYLEIREWEELAYPYLKFILKDEIISGKEKVLIPNLNSNFFRVFLRDPKEGEGVAKKLEELEGVERAVIPKRGTLQNVLASTAGVKAGVIALLVILFLGASLAVRSATRALIHNWEGELQLLHLSGVSSGTISLPFLLMGAFLGLIGALVTILLIYAVHLWGVSTPESFYQMFPAILSSGAVHGLVLRSLGLGLILGLLGGALGIGTLSTQLSGH